MFANRKKTKKCRKKIRIEEKNRKINRNVKNDVRIDYFIETCVDANVSNLIVFETNEIVALKYDVMRICMKLNLQLLFELHLSKSRKENERI